MRGPLVLGWQSVCLDMVHLQVACRRVALLAFVGCTTALVPLRLPFGATVGHAPSAALCRTARLLCLAGPHPTRNRWLQRMARAPPPVAKDEDEESTEDELKDELFDLLDTIPDRGFESSEDDKADVLEIIAELEESPSPPPHLHPPPPEHHHPSFPPSPRPWP